MLVLPDVPISILRLIAISPSGSNSEAAEQTTFSVFAHGLSVRKPRLPGPREPQDPPESAVVERKSLRRPRGTRGRLSSRHIGSMQQLGAVKKFIQRNAPIEH
jgi:hypothetical protein